MPTRFCRAVALLAHLMPVLTFAAAPAAAQPSTLLRQPTLSADHVAFPYAGDVWIVGQQGGEARRLTATPAVEVPLINERAGQGTAWNRLARKEQSRA